MDNKTLKNILEKEISYHAKEIKEHGRLAELRQSKTQKRKMIKHMNKHFQTINIAKKLGFNFCDCCGGLR